MSHGGKKGSKLGIRYSTLCKNLPNEELQLVLLTVVNVKVNMSKRNFCITGYKTEEDP